jgi:hypothetical protein
MHSCWIFLRLMLPKSKKIHVFYNARSGLNVSYREKAMVNYAILLGLENGDRVSSGLNVSIPGKEHPGFLWLPLVSFHTSSWRLTPHWAQLR